MRKLVAITAALLAVAGSVSAVAQTAPQPTSGPSVAALRAAFRDGTVQSLVRSISACGGLNCNMTTLSIDGTAPLATKEPAGFGAQELQKIYNMQDDKPSTIGTHVAIIVPGAYPDLDKDLAAYRSYSHLKPCRLRTGCLTQIGFDGNAPEPPPSSDDPSTNENYLTEMVAFDTAMTVEMVSAMCPLCRLLVLHAPLADAHPQGSIAENKMIRDFALATRTAAARGAKVVSISWGRFGINDYANANPRIRQWMHQPGVAVMAASGDSGFVHEGYWPSSLPDVISVGGTAVYPRGDGGYTHVASTSSGSGCAELGLANGQPAELQKFCGGSPSSRPAVDLSMVGDSNTPVAYYVSYAPYSGPLPPTWSNWYTGAGTSVSVALAAGLYGRHGVASDTVGPNHIYAASASAYTDIVAGSTAPLDRCGSTGDAVEMCAARVGWDGPTGRGSPNSMDAFGPMVGTVVTG